MPFPLMAVAIGAGIGALAGGFSGGGGFDLKKALLGGALGGATGGLGAGALAPAAATSGAGAGALAGGVGAGSVGGSGAAGLAAIQSGGMATTASGLGAGIGSTAMPFDYGKLGKTIQSFGESEEIKEEPLLTPDPGDPSPLSRADSESIEKELRAEKEAIERFTQGQTSPGLSNTAAKGGIATRYGIMKTPSGSLTGGEIVGPGTGTSDTIRSAIYPDVASKLGASSSPVGMGHRVQNAALSDGEFVVTAKAVEGVGKNAGAPPGQEREYGSKLLDQAMNQWQRT